jgi:hypothetical protein
MKAVSVMSLGMINPGYNGVIINDAYTGIANLFAHLNDHINHPKEVGVWIGKRVLHNSPVGVAFYPSEFLNLNPLHYAFRIDGRAFNLEIIEEKVFKILPLE